MRVLWAEPDLLLVTIVCVALAAGSVPGAAAGFAGGLLVDAMTLGTLGVTSIVLTLAGYWAGRYGETTGRGRRYAAPLAAFAISILAEITAVKNGVKLPEAASVAGAKANLQPTPLCEVAQR